MAIGDAFSAPMGVKNQMYGQPQRVPGYAEGYAQAPGQARPALPPEPYPIGRPTGVVGGPAYYTPPGFQAPPQPTEAFMPTDRMPDPIGQQFMRQYQSPMGQQFIDQYEATQAPIRQAELEAREAERARQDQRFQEMMDRIAELEGQLTAREEAATIPQPNIPVFDTGNPLGIDLSGLPDFSQIDFSGIPDFLKNLNIPGITDRPMEGTGREEAPIDRPDPRNFAIDSVTGEVIPGEDVILRPMPVPDPEGYVRRTLPLPPPPPTPDLASIPIPQAPAPIPQAPVDVTNMGQNLIDSYNEGAAKIRKDIGTYRPTIEFTPPPQMTPPAPIPTPRPSPMPVPRQTPVDVTNMGKNLIDSYNEGVEVMRGLSTAPNRFKQEFIPTPTIAPVRGMPQLPPMPTITPRMPSMPSPRPSMQNIPRINLSKLGIR